MLELVSKRRYKIVIHLNRGPPRKESLFCAAQREALPVAVPRLVGEVDVGVRLTDVQHPAGEQDLAGVPDVSARCVEAHHSLCLEPGIADLHKKEQDQGREG